MKKNIILSFLFLIFFSSCNNQVIKTDNLQFVLQDDHYFLQNPENNESYENLIKDLEALNKNLNKDTKVAVISTSTANIIDALNMNIVGLTSSSSLNENLQNKLSNKEITNLGSALDPNLEQLSKLNADVVFVGSNMPHEDHYNAIENLVVLPQKTYPELFYTMNALITEFDLSNEAKEKFDELVQIDQEAKQLAQTKEISGTTVALKYAYGDITIAPNNTYIGSLLTELNINNLYGDLKDVSLPMNKEKLLTDNPDNIIVYGKGDDFEKDLNNFKNDKKLKNLKAYKNNQIYALQSESLNADINSPQTLLDLSKDIYGK